MYTQSNRSVNNHLIVWSEEAKEGDELQSKQFGHTLVSLFTQYLTREWALNSCVWIKEKHYCVI